jgi:3-hydroxyisobutyrate dehydrogenase
MAVSVGFIGLGAMGAHMARNLHRHHLLSAIWNRSADKATQLASELSVHCADSIASLAQSCQVVVTCIAADADVLAVVDELAKHLLPGAIVIDCSTISADSARQAAKRLSVVNVEFLDAPVSGGVEGARKGSLAIMVGGKEDVFQRALRVLQAMGTTITRFGEVGAGQSAKAVNQIMCAGIIQAISEAMAFAKAEGLSLPALIDTLGQGAGSSWYFVNRAPNMALGEYPAGFRVKLHQKDLEICRDMAAKHSVQLPIVEMTLLHYRRLIEQGHGDEDISSLFRLKDAMFDS